MLTNKRMLGDVEDGRAMLGSQVVRIPLKIKQAWAASSAILQRRTGPCAALAASLSWRESRACRCA